MGKNSNDLDLQAAARAIVARLPEKTGFILLATPGTDDPKGGEAVRMTYVSNLKRENAVNILKEWMIKCSAEEDWMKTL